MKRDRSGKMVRTTEPKALTTGVDIRTISTGTGVTIGSTGTTEAETMTTMIRTRTSDIRKRTTTMEPRVGPSIQRPQLDSNSYHYKYSFNKKYAHEASRRILRVMGFIDMVHMIEEYQNINLTLLIADEEGKWKKYDIFEDDNSTKSTLPRYSGG